MGISTDMNEEFGREVMIDFGVVQVVFWVSPFNIGEGILILLGIPEVNEEPFKMPVFVVDILNDVSVACSIHVGVGVSSKVQYAITKP